MPEFKTLIKDYVSHTHYMGDEVAGNANEDKRTVFVSVLKIRKQECRLRFNVSVIVLMLALFVLLYLVLFYQDGIEVFKQATSLFGGGSILALVYYLISLRDEITKINQTMIIASVVDTPTLNTMLLALSAEMP